MTFVRRNVLGEWQVIPVKEADEKKIIKDTYERNLAILLKIKSDPRTKDLNQQEIVAIFNTLARHYHYNVENYVDQLLQESKLETEIKRR